MATSRKIIKVFIASPGDLKEERQAAKHVVDQFNKQWADYFSTHVELVGWEDTVSRFGRPQDLINQDLDQCEVFIGVMWKQWGSPPSKDGPYTSGFEEEFERAVMSRKRSKRPEISLLFKDIESEFLKDPGESLRKVEAFKTKIISERTILFQRFANQREFEDKIRDCVTSYVQNLRAEEVQKITDETTGKISDTSGDKATSYWPLSLEGAEFVKEFVAKTERGESAVTPVEAAHFRLLASMVGVSGNDTYPLGVHDANILFFERSKIGLGLREMRGVVDSGLAHFSNENVPFWHWYAAVDCTETGYLSSAALLGQPPIQIGALRAMRLISEPIKPQPNWERIEYLQLWFHDSVDERLKVAALEYLAACGKAEDLPLIRAEYERGDYRTVGPATDAILRLTLKESRDAALKTLNELQPEQLDAGLIRELFSKPDTIETSLLTAAITHRSPMVRKAVVPILVARKALPSETAELLLNDADASVRFYSLRSLIDAGRDYADEKAKDILVKPIRSTGLGLSLGVGAMPDKQGEAYYETLKAGRLRGLTETALERIIGGESLFDRDARFALDFKKFNERGPALRAAIDDKFRSLVSSDIKALEERLGADHDTIKKLYSVEEILRKQFCRQALDLICEKNQAQDLARVRAAISEGFVDYSPLDFEFLKRHGEWQDVKLLISLVERREQGSSLLAGVDENAVEQVSDAIAVIGKGRLAELIQFKMHYRLLEAIIKRSANKEVATLSHDELMTLLTWELDVIRKVTSLKVIRSLPGQRIKALLDRYLESDGQRYYNVIYWLDFGISLPKSRVMRATHAELTKF